MPPSPVTRSFTFCARPHRAGAFALAALLAGLVWAAPATAQDKDWVAARVNGIEIRQGDLDLAEAELGSALPGDKAAKREALITFYADMLLAARAAEAKGLGSTVDFARKLAFAKTKLLMETLLETEAKAAVTEKAMREVYDKAVKDMASEQEVRAHHILVETEEEAKAILAALRKGADFAQLAKEKSQDPSAAARGGDLGYFTKDQMVAEFAEAAFALDKGQLSEPVKTQFGWHIIRLDDKRTKPVPTYEAVKPQLEQYVTRRAQADTIARLRAGAKIERTPAPGGN